jgi:hypothetical protein
VARDTLRQATEVTGIDALHGLLGRTDRYWLSDCWIDVASDEVRPTEWRWSCRRLTYGVRTEIGALQIDDPMFTKRLTTEAAALPLGVWTIDQTPTQAAHRRLRQWALGERQSAESVVSAIRNARGLVRDLRKNEWDVTEIKSPEEATAPHVVAIARHLPTNAWYAAIPGGSVTLGVVEPGESEFPLVSAWVSPFLLALEPQPGALFTGSAAANLLDWPMREQTGRPSAARLPTESEWEWGMRCIYGATVLVQQDRQARLPEVQHLVGLADWEVTCTPGDLPQLSDLLAAGGEIYDDNGVFLARAAAAKRGYVPRALRRVLTRTHRTEVLMSERGIARPGESYYTRAAIPLKALVR